MVVIDPGGLGDRRSRHEPPGSHRPGYRAVVQRLVCLLIFLSALPDAMVVPVLKDLMVDRYGVTRTQAQAFLLVNLIGAALAVALMPRLQRSVTPLRLLVMASVADAVLLSAPWFPLGWSGTMVVRTLEGVPDAITFGLLLQLLGRSGRGSVPARLGLGSMVLLGGVGCGMALGGLAGKLVGPGQERVVFLLGAASSALVAVLVLVRSSSIAGATEPTDEGHAAITAAARGSSASVPASVPPWVVLSMAFVDRATGGVLTGTLSLFLAGFFPYDASERGWMVGLPLLAMAAGAWPAGAAAARIGTLQVRLVAGMTYAAALAVVPFVGDAQPLLVALLAVLGLAGAALLPTSLALEHAVDRGAAGFTAFATSGGIGYASGAVIPVMVLGVAGEGAASYQGIIVGFALLHAAVTCCAIATTRGWRGGAVS
jgi:MFS family permease